MNQFKILNCEKYTSTLPSNLAETNLEIGNMEDLLQFVLDMGKSQEYMDIRLETIQNVVINSVNEEITTAFTYKKAGIGIRILVNGA